MSPEITQMSTRLLYPVKFLKLKENKDFCDKKNRIKFTSETKDTGRNNSVSIIGKISERPQEQMSNTKTGKEMK